MMSKKDNPDSPSRQLLLSQEKVETSVEQLNARLLRYDEIPSWQQENEYILTGYRPTSGSWQHSVHSLSYIHNETVSTYTHLVGCVIFLFLPFHFRCITTEDIYEPRFGDLLCVSTYLIGVSVCFGLSAVCHILWNCTEEIASFANKLDYLGILVLMWGASIPTIYYGLCDNTSLQKTYWVIMTLLALACAIFTMNHRFSQPRFRQWRAVLYTLFGLSSAAFVLHGLLLYGLETQKRTMSLPWMAWMATFNLFGAAAYATRLPEKLVPCRFDIVGGSHQIFHLAVAVAACIHYVGLIRAFESSRGSRG